MGEQRLYKIGEVAERTGLSQKTLRDYDAWEVLPPTDHSDGGFRLYSERDVQRLEMIVQMKPLGFSLAEATALLDALRFLDDAAPDVDRSAVHARVRLFVEDARVRRERLGDDAELADAFIAALRELETDI